MRVRFFRIYCTTVSIIGLVLVLPLAGLAQPKQNSPYSRLGLGDFQPQYFAHHAGMGGLSTAYHDPHHLTPQNPASMAFLRTATFESGMYANYSHFTSDEQSTLNNWSGNLGYLALGFTLRSPINEALDKVQSHWKWGMGFSLSPYTLVGYDIFSIDTLPDLGEVTNRFRGDGGTYQLAWSNAVRYKQTSLGLTLGWMFGAGSFDNSSFIADSLPTFENNFSTDARINGFVWKVGVQHDWVLKYSENDLTQPVKWVTFGLTVNSNHPAEIRADQLQIRSRGEFANGVFISPDTLLYEEGAKKDLTLPAGLSAGATLVRINKYKLGIQYDFTNWNAYENQLQPEDLKSTHSVAVGGEYIPDYASYNNYFKKVRLRLGAYYRQDPRVVDGQQLNDFGGSIGFGWPIVLPRLQTSYINTAFEAGHLGAGTPIRETYFRFTVGFCLNDNSWFYKRRFE